MNLPEEFELISVLQTLPKTNDENLDFYYRENIYDVRIDNYQYMIKISPSYEEVSLNIFDHELKKDVINLKLDEIEKISIQEDFENHSVLEFISDLNEDAFLKIKLRMRPYFSLDFEKIIFESTC